MGKAVRQDLYIEGLEPLLREFRQLPAELKRETALAARAIADMVATETAGAASTAAERKTAGTIKRSGNAAVKAGNPGTDAGRMFFGTEFGGQGRPSTQQFREHHGRDGYIFWPKIRSMSRRILDAWSDMLGKVVRDG